MVKVNLIGFKQFQDKLKTLPANLQKEIGAELNAAADDFRDRAINDAPADVGLLRSQITVKPINALRFEVVSGSKYSAPMEFGTKSQFLPIPGIDSSEFKGLPRGGSFKEMIASIRKWCERKGIDPSLAFVITRSIIRKGVRPHPFFFKQIAPVRRDLFRNIRNIIKQL